MKTNTTPSNGFRIYSNDAEYPPSENVLVLAQNTPEDQFVASLKDKCITLSRRPATNTYTTVDSQDRWMAWLENFGHDCECSLMVDPSQAPDKALQCFRFSIETPWGQAKFDSSSTYLQSAFGKEPAAFVQSPGVVVMTTGPVLHCGLVKPSLAFKPTVEQLFKFAEQEGTIKNLPYGIPELTGVLNASNYSGVRNALWFDPVFFPNTNIQLRFQLNSVRELQDVFTEVLPGFQITEAEVICKKKGNAEGSVGFAASCNIKTKDEQVTTMAYIHFTYSNVTLTLKPEPGKIDQILEWLKDVVGLSPASIRAMFGPKTIFHGLDVQSLMIDFSLDRVNDDPGVLDIQLSYLNLKVDVIGNFGKVDDKEPVFLVTYIWRGPTDFYTARGRLWTCKSLKRPSLLVCNDLWMKLTRTVI